LRLGATEIVALMGVAGTLLGTLGGATLNHFLSKWKEDEARKRESKQRAYEEFAALTLLPNRFHETSEHFEQLAGALAGMDLYGALDVRRTAKRTYHLELERDEHQEGSEEYQRLDAALESSRAAFVAAARKELGFPTAE
jgi:hypothetical protein